MNFNIMDARSMTTMRENPNRYISPKPKMPVSLFSCCVLMFFSSFGCIPFNLYNPLEMGVPNYLVGILLLLVAVYGSLALFYKSWIYGNRFDLTAVIRLAFPNIDRGLVQIVLTIALTVNTICSVNSVWVYPLNLLNKYFDDDISFIVSYLLTLVLTSLGLFAKRFSKNVFLCFVGVLAILIVWILMIHHWIKDKPVRHLTFRWNPIEKRSLIGFDQVFSSYFLVPFVYYSVCDYRGATSSMTSKMTLIVALVGFVFITINQVFQYMFFTGSDPVFTMFRRSDYKVMGTASFISSIVTIGMTLRVIAQELANFVVDGSGAMTVPRVLCGVTVALISTSFVFVGATINRIFCLIRDTFTLLIQFICPVVLYFKNHGLRASCYYTVLGIITTLTAVFFYILIVIGWS